MGQNSKQQKFNEAVHEQPWLAGEVDPLVIMRALNIDHQSLSWKISLTKFWILDHDKASQRAKMVLEYEVNSNSNHSLIPWNNIKEPRK